MEPTSLVVTLVVIAFCAGVVLGLVLRDSHTEYRMAKLREELQVLNDELVSRDTIATELERDLRVARSRLIFAKKQAPGPVRDNDPPDAPDDSERRLDERDRARECRRGFER